MVANRPARGKAAAPPLSPPTRPEPMAAPLFTFETTHHALWAEEVAAEQAIPCEVVPAPTEAGAGCHLALETLPGLVPRLADALRAAGVDFRLFPG